MPFESPTFEQPPQPTPEKRESKHSLKRKLQKLAQMLAIGTTLTMSSGTGNDKKEGPIKTPNPVTYFHEHEVELLEISPLDILREEKQIRIDYAPEIHFEKKTKKSGNWIRCTQGT
ncbi:MAG: hypothetical protein HQ402_00775 [Parcubacteria group bacterium]|nr:hypothetical protein [Parcubacteria group bacterium]